MPTKFLTADEARALLEAADRRNAERRAEYPEIAHLWPPVSDEIWCYVIERALLGELRPKPLLPPLKNDPRSPGDKHD
jgi:hypothetical protein